MIANLSKDAKEKIAKDYVRRLEDENARLLRKVIAAKVIAAKDVLYQSEPAKAKFVPGRNYPDMNWLEIDERDFVGMIRLPIDAAELQLALVGDTDELPELEQFGDVR